MDHLFEFRLTDLAKKRGEMRAGLTSLLTHMCKIIKSRSLVTTTHDDDARPCAILEFFFNAYRPTSES